MSEATRTRVVLFGGTGRMGATVVSQLADHEALIFGGMVRRVRGGPELEGMDVSAKAVAVNELLASADVAIDFSLPEAVERHVALCSEYNLPYACGVTALDEGAISALSAAATDIPVLWAPNMSTGVTICFAAAADIAVRLGAGFSVVITDIHHVGKQDAPSGTALEFGRVIQAAAGDVEIAYESVREGSHAGEHHIIFSHGGDQIELRHVAGDRGEFASGAIRAAQWLISREPGVYNMRNVLGITSSS